MGYKDKNKQREYQKIWFRNRRGAFLENKCCVICGSKEKLELHHIDPITKISHNIWSWSDERRNKELEKCTILCRKHHIEHHALLMKTKDHGNAMYNRGCRCYICRFARNEKAKIYRNREKIIGIVDQ